MLLGLLGFRWCESRRLDYISELSKGFGLNEKISDFIGVCSAKLFGLKQTPISLIC